jgi:meso-butanediol dehydrogenase/(S,S)-butanediol dehydrogenase/diacetyl reductase
MAGRLNGKVAVITGAASGIGEATARRFAEEGAQLVLSDVNQGAGEALAKEIGARAFVPADVSKPNEVEALMQAAVDRAGALHIVFNNAGVGFFGKAPDLEVEHWRQVLAIDLDSVFYGCKYAIPHMRRAGGGAIVNTASISGLFGDYGLLPYNAAKGGVVNLTRTVAIDHARENIRCNCVCPGPIDTPLLKPLLALPAAAEGYRAVIPMGRVGRAEEIAAAVAFLASDDASYVTGAALVIDGGVTAATGQINFNHLMGGE